MNKAVSILLFSSVVLMADSPGIRPRADAQSYPTHVGQADYSIGAVVIPPEQVKKMFRLDLNHAGYVVIEVGVFPAAGKDVDLYPTDFTLSVGDKLMGLRPVSADTVAELAAGKTDAPAVKGPHDVNTSVGASVGHVSYTDPVTGRRTIAQDLWEKSLPDGKTAHAVAGYLYFPAKKAKDAVWELHYENAEVKCG